MLFAARRVAFRQVQGYIRPSKISSRQNRSALVRLVSSLAVLEQRGGSLQIASLSAITAAQKLGGPVTGFVAGSNAKLIAEEAAKVKGLERVVVVENDAYDKVRLLWHT